MVAPNNGPILWSKIALRLREVYPSLVVAGGAVRDFAVDKMIEPKDVDIFVPAESSLDFEMSILGARQISGFQNCEFMDPMGGSYNLSDKPDLGPPCLGVVEGYFFLDSATYVKYNIVGKRAELIADPRRLIDTFDHSLCQFWWDGDVSVLRTAAAAKTLETGVVELFQDSERTRQRLEVLCQRKPYRRFSWPGMRVRKSFDEIMKEFTSSSASGFTANACNEIRRYNAPVIVRNDPLANF